MIKVVSATRHSKTHFWRKTALGQSLQRLAHDKRLISWVAFENRRGLSDVYNSQIESGDVSDILVFMHDDVWIDDYHFCDRLIEGLRKFDILGVAGNIRRVDRQPAWIFGPDLKMVDQSLLSGAVAHGSHPFGAVTYFGAVGQECDLLDGVLLACKRDTTLRSGLRFDSAFDFHFYDLDFCRSAKALSMSMGTWPIAITHQSNGGTTFGQSAWLEKLNTYLSKWGA